MFNYGYKNFVTNINAYFYNEIDPSLGQVYKRSNVSSLIDTDFPYYYIDVVKPYLKSPYI